MPAMAPFSLAADPAQAASLNPNNNLGGSSTAGFVSTGPVAIGGAGNPLQQDMPGGQRIPPLSSPTTSPGAVGPGAAPIPAYTSPYGSSGSTSAVASLTPGTPETSGNLGDIAQSLQHTYYGGAGTALAQFLQGGAGYNPAVANSLIAALQPQIAQGRANLMEQFGSMGLGSSSAAALGLGAYDAQTNLDVGTILSQLYEQSVQNYLGVLEGTAGHGVNEGQQLANTILGGIFGNASISTGSGGTSVGF